MYESPITVFNGPPKFDMDGEILKAVFNVGVHVDKEELLRALRYDRDQYDKGFRDALDSMVRCKDCTHKCTMPANNLRRIWCNKIAFAPPEDFYCPYGERREVIEDD